MEAAYVVLRYCTVVNCGPFLFFNAFHIHYGQDKTRGMDSRCNTSIVQHFKLKLIFII